MYGNNSHILTALVSLWDPHQNKSNVRRPIMKIRERQSVELDRFQLFCDACQAINNLITIILALSHAFKSKK
jgi:hypothetical protein